MVDQSSSAHRAWHAHGFTGADMTDPPTPGPSRLPLWRLALPGSLGVAWLVVAGVALLVPALVHGTHIGTYDLLAQHGLSSKAGVVPHNYVNNDQIDEMIPWSDLVWTQVHQGHLPLWNPYSGLGLPLAFNWQSAPMSLGSLVGYLVPLQYSYDVGMIVTLIVAGTGVFALARVLRLGLLASVFAGTVFELSGPLTGWLGYPHGEVMAWGGWLFATALLVIRREHRMRNITLLAVVVAMLVYSGQPEVMAVFGLALILFVAVLMVQRTALARATGQILLPVMDLVVATVAGLALAAPLALPGLQAISRSNRSGTGNGGALQLHNFMYFISQGFDGLPIVGSHVFGQSLFYQETTSYVGIIAVVLAVLALTVRFRRPEVVAFSVVAAVMLAIVFVRPLNSAMNSLPILGRVNWDRALMATVLSVAVLSGFGLDALVRSHTDRAVRRRAVWCFLVATAGLIAIYLFGRGDLPPELAGIRNSSFVGPALGLAAGLIVLAMITIANRSGHRFSLSPSAVGRAAGVILLVCETVWLVSAGAPLLSSSATFLTPTPAESTLRSTVGSATVGFGNGQCGSLGIDVSDNDALGVYEFDAYDPILPSDYYSSWDTNTGTYTGIPLFNEFCPSITNASEARLYGVGFVLEPAGAAGPRGGVFVRDIDNEALYRIPGAGIATLTPLLSSGALPPVQAQGSPVTVHRPDATTWHIETSGSVPQVLRLRLSNEPGWHATIDGKPLALESFAGAMLQARVPAGAHSIDLYYWPSTLTYGMVLAGLAVVGLVGGYVVERRRRRKRAVP
jgi:hypothetical protein